MFKTRWQQKQEAKHKGVNWYTHHGVKTTAQRGYGAAWQRQRKRIIRRDAGLCQPCLKVGRVTAFAEVDHIVNLAAGGSDSDDNLQCICLPCHKVKTAAEAQKGKA